MKTDNTYEIKKPRGPCCVITAKPPEHMKKEIDKFREDRHFNSKNDAILVLVANGLRYLDLIDEGELKQYLELYAPHSVKGDTV